MANQTVSYTGRDVSDIRKELIDMIPSLTEYWTDFNESDLGIAMIELIAGAQDMQNFYFDTQAFETHLDTAVQAKNVRSIARAMNYRIPLKSTATGQLVITFVDDSYKVVDIPQFTAVNSTFAEVVQSYLVAETVHEEGEFDELSIPIMEGKLNTLTVSSFELHQSTTSTGNPSRRIYLGSKEVADGTVRVIQEGEMWEEVDDALLEYNGGRYYSVHVDSSGQVYILMSVNFLDLIPEDEGISIQFVTTSGIAGQVRADVLNQIDIDRGDIENVTNTFGTFGASNGPDLFRMKVLARRNAITMDRYITLEDYQTAVESEPYVYRSVVKDWKYPDFVEQPYLVRVWAVDYTGHYIGDEYAKQLRDKLLSKGNVGVDVEVMSPTINQFNIEANVILLSKAKSDRELIRENIIDYLRNAYSMDNQDFGARVSYSVLVSRIKSVHSAIKDVLVMSPTGDIECEETEFPVVSEIKIHIVDSF